MLYISSCREEKSSFNITKSLSRILIQSSRLTTGQVNYKTKLQLEADTNAYNITTLLDYQGLYFEQYGAVKLSHINWDLVAFVDLTTSGSQYSVIRSQYEATIEVCDRMMKRFGSEEYWIHVSDLCSYLE